MASTVTPISEATQALLESSDEALLDAIVQITHRVHGLGGTNAVRATELRWQRDMLRAEALRRMAGDAR